MTRAPKAWNRRLTTIVEQGFTVADAALWATALSLDRSGRVARTAVEYRDAGFTAVEGARWDRVVVTTIFAVRLAAAGWTPDLAASLRDRIPDSVWNFAHVRDEGPVTDWLNTGIPPAWVLLYIDAGIDPVEAAHWEARRDAGDEIGPGLALLAALR
jgi:hypothetical protein